MGDVPLATPPQDDVIDAMGGIIRDVADYRNHLGAIGYTAGMTATPEFVTKFMVIMAIVGPAIILLSAAIFAVFYKITDEKAAFYAAENMKRMSAPALQKDI